MSVRAILERKGRDVVTVSPTVSVEDAARLLHERKIGAVVVTGGEGQIAGIFTERDIVTAIAANGREALAQPIATVMTATVYRCGEDATINELMELMSVRRFRHVPVERDGRLAGIVSIGDVVKSRIAEIEHEAEQIKAYIAG